MEFFIKRGRLFFLLALFLAVKLPPSRQESYSSLSFFSNQTHLGDNGSRSGGGNESLFRSYEPHGEDYGVEKDARSDSYNPHGGYDHYGGGGHDDHGGYGKKPGPYGKAIPNFKCDKIDKTLYVTRTDLKYKDDCFNVYKTNCKTVYDVGKDIGYKMECDEFSVTRCRTVYDTDIKKKCTTFYTKKCSKFYETVEDWIYEQKCSTSYDEVCSGYGYHKHCESHPKEKCKQVPRQVQKHIPKTKCKKIPKKKCNEFPIHIPKKECKDFPKKICTQVPVQVKKDITKKVCKSIPKKVCNSIPITIISHIPKTVWFKKCHSTKSEGYGKGGHDHNEGFGRSDEKGGAVIDVKRDTSTKDLISIPSTNAKSPSQNVATPPIEPPLFTTPRNFPSSSTKVQSPSPYSASASQLRDNQRNIQNQDSTSLPSLQNSFFAPNEPFTVFSKKFFPPN